MAMIYSGFWNRVFKTKTNTRIWHRKWSGPANISTSHTSTEIRTVRRMYYDILIIWTKSPSSQLSHPYVILQRPCWQVRGAPSCEHLECTWTLNTRPFCGLYLHLLNDDMDCVRFITSDYVRNGCVKVAIMWIKWILLTGTLVCAA